MTLLAGVAFFAGGVWAQVPSVACANRANNTQAKLQECVTLNGVKSHLTAFQAIANANGGSRHSGTAGYNQSLAYVQGKLEAAGYRTTKQEFSYSAWLLLTAPIVQQVAPGPLANFANEAMTYSGSGDVTAAVSNVASFGCNPVDFAGFPAGNIALMQRGACTFAIKASNAAAAGASAVVIFNNVGALPISGTLGADFTENLPVVSVSQADGVQLAATGGLQLRVAMNAFRGTATSANLIAESARGDSNTVAIAGASLESAALSPGINGNGSGAAALLETALMMARTTPRNRVRFAWWGGQSGGSGARGSQQYVSSLSSEELGKIALYLNFDNIASPNYGFFVLDGDNSEGTGGAGPQGSGAVEQMLLSFYEGRGIPVKAFPNFFTSDLSAFAAADIPIGSIYAGSIEVKTAAEQQLWGGTAGIAYDPCAREACDTIANISDAALNVNSDAVAFAVLESAMSVPAIGTAQTASSRKKSSSRIGVIE